MSARPARSEAVEAFQERRRLLETAWMMTLVVAAFAVATPWFLRLLDIALAPVVWCLFAYAIVYLGVSRLTDRLADRRAVVGWTVAAQSAGVVLLGVVWHWAGGLANPAFLLLFVLPVVIAGFTGISWQPYFTSLLGVVSVVGVALHESLELRWALARLLPSMAWMMEALPQPAAPGAFAGFSAPPSYYLVLVGQFALLLVAVALISEPLVTLLLGLARRLDLTSRALAEAEGLASGVLQAAPYPAALVARRQRRVVQASRAFRDHLLLGDAELGENDLFDLVDFTYPEVIEDLLERGGEIPFAVYRVGPEARVARVSAYGFRDAGIDYSYLTLHDVSDLSYLQAALDALGEPFLIIGGNGRLLYANRPARGLAQGLVTGAMAPEVLDGWASPEGWWRLGPRRSLTRQVTGSGREWEAAAAGTRLPGEPETVTVLRLRPAAEAALV